MARLETALTVEQILDSLRQLSDQEQRALAAAVVNDQKLEALIEELDDHLTCERAAEEGSAQPFTPEELAGL
jgi:flagellar biosynthesis/type III secretory pathway chaperone